MIVAAHQPHFLPWLGYLDKLAKADLFVIMDDLQYEAQNYQNRQRIVVDEHELWLTVPLVRGGQHERICDKQIDHGGNAKQHWQRRIWLTLEQAYRRAPYFAAYRAELEDVFSRWWTSLLALDLHMLDLARRWFGITTPIVRSSTLGLEGAKTDRLIDLCRKVGARAYLSGGGGSTTYLDPERIGRAGIGLIWQQFTHPTYPQVAPGFVPRLGFIDLLCNAGGASRDLLFDRSHPMRLAA
ncbi:MAG: WbqC family protein [Deltaproteobacteria bacterium]